MSAPVLRPWDVALGMMRRGRDAGLIVAYLEVEASRAGVDPFDLSQHPGDVIRRLFRNVGRAFDQMGRVLKRHLGYVRAA